MGTDNRNGTCYTSEECEDRDGAAAGSCADGYGICCTCKSRAPITRNLFALKFPRFFIGQYGV